MKPPLEPPRQTAFSAPMQTPKPHRRFFLAAGAAILASPGVAHATTARPPVGRLDFLNLHTGERLSTVFREGESYNADALAAINHVLRDHRTHEVHVIHPELLETLVRLRQTISATGPFQVISGYRSPATNAALHAASSGVASRSLHMDGMAIDIRAPGVRLSDLRDAAWDLQAGGVGYYPDSEFVHIDIGRVRRW